MASMRRKAREMEQRVAQLEDDVAFLLRERNTGGRPVGSTPPAIDAAPPADDDVSRETTPRETGPEGDVSRETESAGAAADDDVSRETTPAAVARKSTRAAQKGRG